MNKIKVTFRPENLTLEYSATESMDLWDAVKRLIGAFPGMSLEALGGPMPVVVPITQRLAKKSQSPEYRLTTSPYAGKKLDEVELFALKSWRRHDAQCIPAEERAIIDAYLQKMRNEDE